MVISGHQALSSIGSASRGSAAFLRALLLGALVASFSAFSASPVFAGEEERDARWIPSFSLYTAGLPEHRRAEADSEVSGVQDGESVGFPWSFGTELGVASPVLGESRWKPRLTLHAGVGYVIEGNDPVSTVDDPGSRPLLNPAQPDPTSFNNQGSAVRAQAKPWVLTGGIGALFEFDVFERTVYLRPSLEWMYRKDTIEVLLGKAEGEILLANDECAPCRVLFIAAQTEKGYHSLGGGLEAAVEGGRLGGFTMRFFASGRVYGILGDREAAISPTGDWLRTDGLPTTRPDPQTTFNARYERKLVHYRVGVGLQMLWQPE